MILMSIDDEGRDIEKDEVGKLSFSLWTKIMAINKTYNRICWKYIDYEDFMTDLVSEVGEFANDVKHFHDRGSKQEEVTKDQLQAGLFDMFVYIVLGFESFLGDEKKFLEIGNTRLDIIKNRLKEKMKNGQL